MATSYPGGLDAFTNPTSTDSLNSATVPHATQHANANDAIEAIQAELGTDPAGASATVKARFDAIEANNWVTTTRINDAAVTSAKIADGTIVNGDINASAAIDLSKLATGALPTGITVASANIVDGTIVNADINASAAIAQSKIASLTTDLAAKVITVNLLADLGMSTTVVDTFPRRGIANTGIAFTSGTVSLTMFTPLVDVTVSQITSATGTTAASGLTLARWGLFTVSGSNVTLVARTASDTTLFTATSTAYTRSFDTTGGYPATYDLVAGTRYAVGMLFVGTTMPQGVHSANVAAMPTLGLLEPAICGVIAGQTDLPTTSTAFTGVTLSRWARLS